MRELKMLGMFEICTVSCVEGLLLSFDANPIWSSCPRRVVQSETWLSKRASGCTDTGPFQRPVFILQRQKFDYNIYVQ